MKITNNLIETHVVNEYIKGVNNIELSNKYDLHRTTIQRILLRNNVTLRKQNITSRKHILINENYFNIIDTEEKGYVLGLLYADGYINKNGFGISLIEGDKEILEKLSIIFYNKIVLGYRKGKLISNKYFNKPQYRLEIVSMKMKNDLIAHGCMEAKSFKIRFPVLYNENIYRAFIRGYYDGDGCLTIPTKKASNVTLTITSNTKFCNELAEYVNRHLDINMKSVIRYNNIGCTRLTGKLQIIKFLNWMYLNSSIHLMRKYDKYMKLWQNT